MFYSQIILAKKGPLGKVWLAAHWGDKKLGRNQIFTTDISQSVQDIVHPAAPLALRVSGHLLLGVVRIYSRKVKYLKNDVEEAAVKMKMTFKGGGSAKKRRRKDVDEEDDDELWMVNLHPARGDKSPRKSKNTTGGVHNVQNFGEYEEDVTNLLDNAMNLPGVQPVSNDQFVIPFSMDPEKEGDDMDFQTMEWEAVQMDGELGDPLRNRFSLDAESVVSGRRAMLRDPTQQSQATDESAIAAVNRTLESEISTMRHLPTQQENEETWEAFDQRMVEDEDEDDEDRHVFPADSESLVDDNDKTVKTKDSRVSDIEVVRDADSVESIQVCSSFF